MLRVKMPVVLITVIESAQHYDDIGREHSQRIPSALKKNKFVMKTVVRQVMLLSTLWDNIWNNRWIIFQGRSGWMNIFYGFYRSI